MARQPNTTRNLARNALGYITDQINVSNQCLKDSDDLVAKLSASGEFDSINVTNYKNKKIQEAKDANQNALKMYRWLIGKLSISIPTAYTDSQVDAIDIDIRTFDDGQDE